jgi:RNA polymerase sigma-70 factor (ECF subfamily)
LEKLFQIINGCAIQDRQCQKMLYEQYYGTCLKIAYRYMDSYEQAVEVTNDGFVKMFRNFGRFEIRDPERMEIVMLGWMRRIVINAAIDYRRKEKNIPETSELVPGGPDYKDDSRLSDNGLLFKELICLVRELPPIYRLVFNLHVIEGYSHPEIAKMLGIMVGTSKSNLFKAKLYLQKRLASEKAAFTACLL